MKRCRFLSRTYHSVDTLTTDRDATPLHLYTSIHRAYSHRFELRENDADFLELLQYVRFRAHCRRSVMCHSFLIGRDLTRQTLRQCLLNRFAAACKCPSNCAQQID